MATPSVRDLTSQVVDGIRVTTVAINDTEGGVQSRNGAFKVVLRHRDDETSANHRNVTVSGHN